MHNISFTYHLLAAPSCIRIMYTCIICMIYTCTILLDMPPDGRPIIHSYSIHMYVSYTNAQTLYLDVPPDGSPHQTFENICACMYHIHMNNISFMYPLLARPSSIQIFVLAYVHIHTYLSRGYRCIASAYFYSVS